MPRADLLALSPDDLAALTNRGTVKRAQRELDGAEVTGKLTESQDGAVQAKWSDGVECVLPGGEVVARSRCSCPATELCRHVIRTVLAYQRQSAAAQPATEASAPWNPGDISDEVLARHFKPAVLNQARTVFQDGLLVEIVKSHKPTARFHNLACTLRFQVAGDVRYVHCDCAAEPPCVHVPLAVWAFRRLPSDRASAIISSQTKPLPVPVDVVEQIDQTLLSGVELGLSGAGNPWRDRLTRLEAQCRKAGLIWPAEVVLEIIHHFERYAAHDASFNPEAYAELVGELLIRADAIRRDTGAVPQLLIRGTAADHWTDLASARFIGLGCGVRTGRLGVKLTAFLQDANSGSMVAISRDFADPPADSKESPKEYWKLAQTPALKNASFAQVAAGQLLTQGGKRATNHELVLGRARATVNPQNFSWESLRPPVLVESFAEVRERLRVLPPTALRPRRVAEDFHVAAIAAVEHAAFDAATQTVQAVVKDHRGDLATLRHPYTSRGSEGAERLLNALSADAAQIRYVAGPMRLSAEGLCVQPVAVIVEAKGRTILQPWIDRHRETITAVIHAASDPGESDPFESFGRELLTGVSDLLVVGLKRADASALRAWQQLEQHSGALGLSRLEQAIQPVVQGLLQKSATVDWNSHDTAVALLEVAVVVRMLREFSA